MSLQKKDLNGAIKKYHKNLGTMPHHLPTLAGIAHAYGFAKNYPKSCHYFNEYQKILKEYESRYRKKHLYPCHTGKMKAYAPKAFYP